MPVKWSIYSLVLSQQVCMLVFVCLGCKCKYHVCFRWMPTECEGRLRRKECSHAKFSCLLTHFAVCGKKIISVFRSFCSGNIQVSLEKQQEMVIYKIFLTYTFFSQLQLNSRRKIFQIEVIAGVFEVAFSVQAITIWEGSHHFSAHLTSAQKGESQSGAHALRSELSPFFFWCLVHELGGGHELPLCPAVLVGTRGREEGGREDSFRKREVAPYLRTAALWKTLSVW